MENRTNPRRSIQSLFDPAIMLPAIGGSFRKLDPKRMISNPVMFVVEIVSPVSYTHLDVYKRQS